MTSGPRAAAALFALWLSACGPVEPPSPDGGDGGLLGSLVLVTTDGDGGVAPMAGDVFAIPGSQGGFHVDLGYQLTGPFVGELTFDHRVVRAADEKLVSLGTRTFDLGLVQQGAWRTMSPVNVFMCPTPVGVDIIGRELVFTVRVKDGAGRLLSLGTARATFRCGDAAGAFCESICKG